MGGFQTTRWALLDELHSDDHVARDKALGRLIELYWPPVHDWFRRNGLSEADACDATQAFFAIVILKRRLLDRADRDRGRLRDLMLSSLKNAHIDELRRSKRAALLSHAAPLKGDETLKDADRRPEEILDALWATTMIDEAIRRSEAYYFQTGRSHLWRAFERRILEPAKSGNQVVPLAAVAHDLGFSSTNQAAVAVASVRRTCRRFLEEVARDSGYGASDFQSIVGSLSRQIAS